MSVLIRGMKMPKFCRSCRFSGFGGIRGELNVCMHTGQNQPILSPERMSECPLIELPAQHGRLIDADALKAAVCEALKKALDDDSVNIFGAVLAEFVAQGFTDEIENAPTIIDAEGE